MGAGLPAMQAPRYIRSPQLMPSQASQLPHGSSTPRWNLCAAHKNPTSFAKNTHHSVSRHTPRCIKVDAPGPAVFSTLGLISPGTVIDGTS
ncbi:hypothetical protein DJ480_01015 [Pseudomonas sp. Leaf98]|nr:hypothetical protein DJ480_01015 [Pseudomonas sp. Leaf98]